MRYLDVFTPLFEHNVVNVGRIKSYVEKFAEHTTHENAKEWFRLVLAKYLEKNEEINVPMNDKNQPKPKPDWLDGAVARGDDLRVFIDPDDMTAQFDHLVDWFNSMNDDEQGRAFLDRRDRVMAITVQAAIGKSEQWIKSFSKKAAALALNVTEVWEDGVFSWVKPNDRDSMMRDGGILQNCLGSGTYWDKVADGSQIVYLLHDGKSLPHVAIRIATETRSVYEIKGKSNKPPIGRYVDLCKRFLNHINAVVPSSSSGISDLRAMGLNYDVASQKVTSVRDLGEVVWSENGVDITKVQGTGGSFDYWFHSVAVGEIARLKESAQGRISLLSAVSEFFPLLRPIMTRFLNEYFVNDIKPDASVSFMNLGISFNFKTKVWGDRNDISETVLDKDGIRVISFGSDADNVVYTVFNKNNQETAKIVVGFANGMSIRGDFFSSSREKNEEKIKQSREDTIFALNNIPEIKSFKYSNGEQSRTSIYKAYDSSIFGVFKDVAKSIYKKNGMEMFRLYQESSSLEGTLNRIYSSDKKYEQFYGYECDFSEEYRTFFIDALTNSPELKNINWNSIEYNFCSPKVFFNNGKWGTGSTVGDIYHKIGPIVIRNIARGSEMSYFFSNAGSSVDSMQLAFNKSFNPIEATLVPMVMQPKGLPAAVLWLLKDLKVPPTPLDGDVAANKVMFNVGLTYSTAKGSWALIQDGKVKASEGDIKAVGWRNRTAIVDGDTLVGFFKSPNGVNIDEMTTTNNEEMYRCLEKILPKLNLVLPEDRHQELLSQNGFRKVNGIPQHIETNFPTETILTFKDGFVWQKKAHDPTFKAQEKSDRFSPDRYSLSKEGSEEKMRVNFVDGQLSNLIGDELDDNGSTKSLSLKGLDRIGPAMSNRLIDLMNKTGNKFTALQAAMMKVHFKNGKYATLGDDPEMKNFNGGLIQFDDGMSFRRSGNSVWNLRNDAAYKNGDYHGSTILRVELDEHGIESVKISKKEAKRNVHLYMDHIKKLVELYQQTTG